MRKAWLAAAAVACLVGSGALAAPSAEVLPFVEDDYSRAIADARARGVPLFVDVWAPW